MNQTTVARRISNERRRSQYYYVGLLPQQLDMRQLLPADATEELILELLECEPLHIDDLCRQADLPTATISGTLVMLELKGLVKNLGNMVYGI